MLSAATPAISATPQPLTGKSPAKITSISKAESQKQKQETLTLLKSFLEADTQLYGNSVKAILAYANHVLKARDALKGRSLPVLNFDPWTEFKAKYRGGKAGVSKCIAIAEHAPINSAANLKYLPASLSSIYELTIMSAEEFNRAAKSGTIHPAMTRDEARAIAGKKPHPNKNVTVFGKSANVGFQRPISTTERHTHQPQAELEKMVTGINNERPRTRTTRAEGKKEDHLEAAIALTTAEPSAEPKEKIVNCQLLMSFADYEANDEEVIRLIDEIDTKVTTFKRWIPSLRFIKPTA